MIRMCSDCLCVGLFHSKWQQWFSIHIQGVVQVPKDGNDPTVNTSSIIYYYYGGYQRLRPRSTSSMILEEWTFE